MHDLLESSMELTQKQLFWQGHLAAAEQFDGPLADYAKLHKLDAKKLYVFKGVLRDKTVVPSSFVKVSPQPSGVVQVRRDEPSVAVMLPNGVKLSLPSIDQPGLLERLAKL
jgi:hypothetical protein